VLTVTDFNGNDSTCNAIVTITDLSDTASVTIDAAQTTFCEQATVTFTAIPFDGGPSPLYQWYVNGTALVDGVDVSGATTSVLTTSNSFANSDQITVEMTTSISACSITVVSNPLTLTVNEARPVTFNINASTSTICAGEEVTFSVNPSLITNGGTNPDFQWLIDGLPVSGETSSSFTTSILTDSQIVTLEVTSYVQCANPVPATNTNPITITVNPLPTVTADNGSVCANNQSDINLETLVTNPSGGTLTYYTSETNAENETNSISQIVSPASTTTYWIRSELGTGCYAITSSEISIDALPTVVANSTALNICIGESVTLTGSGATSYTWDNGVSDSIAFNPTSTQTYTVTGTDGNGCYNTDTVTITVNPLPTLVTIDGSVCSGSQSDIDLNTLVTNAGGGTITFHNNLTDSQNGASAISSIVSPLAATTYYVRSELGTGCYSTATIDISIDALPTVFANSTTTVICEGESVTLTGSGATSYIWDNGVSDGVAFTPSGTTTYTVTGTDGNGCYSDDSITITVNPLPTVVANATSMEICLGESVTLTGSGATSYTWTDGVNNYSDGAVVNPTVTTTYTVTGTDGNTCENTAQVTVTVNPLPTVTANASDTAICNGELVTLTGGGASTYTWTDGVNNYSNGVAFAPTSTQTYTVTGTDANGCENTATTTITVNPLPNLTTSNGNVCVSGQTSIDLSSLVTSNGTTITYHSSQANADNGTSAISSTVTPSTSPTTYFVRSEFSTGCYVTDTIQITIEPLPTVVANATNLEICSGDSVTLTGSGATSYTWDNGVTNGVAFNPTTTQTYTVTGTDGFGCYDTDTITITVYPTAPATPSIITGSLSNCPVASGLVYSVTDDSNTISYNWTIPSGYTITSGSGTHSITVTATTTAVTGDFIVTATNPCGTSASSTLEVTIGDVALATAGADQYVCLGTASITLDGFVGGAISPKNKNVWQWSDNGAGGTLPSCNGNQIPCLTGNYVLPVGASAGDIITISIETIDPGGSCGAAYDEMQIFVLANPTATISGSTTICEGGNSAITFNATPNTTVTYNNGSSNQTINIDGTGTATIYSGTLSNTTTYSLISIGYTNNTACTASLSGSATITVNPDATISAPSNNNQTVCINTAISAIDYAIGGGGTGATITGLPNGLSFNSGTYIISGSPTETGTFSYTITTTGTCQQTIATGTITVNPDATISTSSNTNQTVCINTAISDIDYTIGGGGTGATISGLPNGLSFNSSTYTISGSPTETGTFSYTITTTGTCQQPNATGTIVISDIPIVDAGVSLTICSDNTATMDATIGGSATSGLWSTSGTGSFSDNSETAVYTPSTNDINNETVTLTYTTTDATAPCNNVSDSIILTIKEAVQITTQPSNIGVCDNENASFSVVAYADDLSYQWYKDGNPISGATSNTLNFNPAFLTDAGNYHVTVSGNSVCSTLDSNTVTLNVNQLISVTDQPDDLDLCEGSTAEFSVAATGAIASYQWRRNGVDISGENNSTLTLNNVTPSNDGDYDVVIIGVGGTCPSITSDFATLNVTLQPTASISYTSPSYCMSFAGPESVNLSGANAYTGGVFSSTSGLSINASTGAITPSTSTPGTYTIEYLIPTSVCTTTNPTTTVTIYPVTVGGEALGYLDTESITYAREVLTVCHEGDGTIVASDYTGNINEWQYSIDGGVTWTSINETTNSINFINLTETTVFRAEIESGNCGVEYTARVILNVIPPDVKPDPVQVSLSTICFPDTVTFTAQSGLGTGLGLEDGGGDYNTGQLNTQDPDSWLVDGEPGGWTASANNTNPNNWSGTNDHTFPGGIFYDSDDFKFGIANGIVSGAIDNDNDGVHILETPIFNTYALTAFEFQMDQAWFLLAGDYILIELSLDGGLTYNVVLQNITGPSSSGNHGNFNVNHFIFTEDVDGNSLESFLGQDNLRIRLTYHGEHTNSAWAIDNIQFEVDEDANGIEWTDDQGVVISTEHTAVHSPSFPGIHTYGVTSLIDDCRSEGVAGTEFIDVNVNWTDAGPDQAIAQSDCGNNTVTLNAYDNTLTVAQNFANGTWGAYDASDPDSQHPGTGDIGTWSVTSGPTSTCGTGTFSDLNDPRATFTGEPGTYVLRYTVGACYDEVTIDLTSCNTIDFDGVNDHITFFDNYPLNGPFSLEVWIKSEVNNGRTQTILSKRNANSQVDGYDLRLVNRRISFNWNNGQSITSPFNINTDRWYHIAVTFNGSLYKLYIDGIEVNSVSGSAPTTNSNQCILGGMDKNGPPKNYFEGWMDELRIWDKALSKEHIRHMMNQEIEDGGAAVVGSVLGLNIEGPDTNNDNVDDNVISWSNLLAYYKMDNLGCGYLYSNNTTGNDGKLRNINTIQPQTAPLPYITIADGDWTDVSGATPWLYGNSVWDYPNSNGVNGDPIDWNIVRASHNLNSGNKNIYLLGLLLDTPDKTLKIFNPIEAQNENNSGYELFISHYLQLAGNINLIGESQLIQKRYNSNQLSGSYYDPAGVGFIKRDQQGTTNLFNYNYWSSPVSATNSTSINEDYNISSILQDGTFTTNPVPVSWTGSYNATGSVPITLSNSWIYAYENYPNNIDPWLTYAEWRYIGQAGTLATGLGFTMKGSGVGDPVNDVQNYAFVGKPHNGTITNPITNGNEALVGNPYPSAIDSHEFIRDNIALPTGNAGTSASIDGTVYFWEHYESNFTHILEQYEGGYATYNLTGGLGAYMPPLISGTGSSIKIPGRYIPVGQGFYVSALNSTGGDVTFRNNQRIFIREASGTSVYMKAPTNSQASESNSTEDPDLVKRVRLNFTASNEYVRPLLLGFVSNSNATDGYDFGYDSPVTDVYSNDMYWTIDGDPYAIQGVGEFDNTKQYPVEVIVTNPGIITISLQDLENFDSEIDVFVHDALDGTYFQINQEDLQINLSAGIYTNRFFITFIDDVTLNTEDLDQLESIRLYYLHDTKEIYINWVNSYEIEKVTLINLLGQNVREWDDIVPLNQREIKIPVSNISEGSYIIKVINSNGKSTNKKVIIKQ